MNWEDTSVTKEDYYHMLSMIQIKNDCETLKALIPFISRPIITIHMLPYLALFHTEVQEYFNKRNDSPIDFKNESSFKIADIRNKLKLFDKSYGKSNKQISLIDDLQDQEFKNRLRFSCMKNLNINYNLGIYCRNDGKIIGNTQYSYFLFQDKHFSKSLLKPEELQLLGKTIGTAINSISYGLKDFIPDYHVDTYNQEYKIMYKDFNTTRFNFPKICNSKEITLRLLHILTYVNFYRYVIMDLVNCTNPWQLRVMYITLYYAVVNLNGLANSLDKNIIKEKNLSTILKNGIAFEKNPFDLEFRNCMMHYGLKNKSGECVINDKYLNFETPFFGLVESRFNGYSYAEYFNLLRENIEKLSDLLSTLLPFNLNGLKEL